MATYSLSDFPVNTVWINQETSGSGNIQETVYTVPAGRFARVHVQHAFASGSASSFAIRFVRISVDQVGENLASYYIVAKRDATASAGAISVFASQGEYATGAPGVEPGDYEQALMLQDLILAPGQKIVFFSSGVTSHTFRLRAVIREFGIL